MKVSPLIYEIIKILCRAIKERRLLYFYFESDSGNYWREIRPYMILPRNKKGTWEPENMLELVGLPTEQLETKEKQPGHYFLTKLDMDRFKILDETFNDLGVSPHIVVQTKTPVICRFIYKNENRKEVMKSWIKVSK